MLNVSMGSDYNHTISGYLVSDGARVGSKPVEVYVNNTLKANVTMMDVYGNFSVTLNLPSSEQYANLIQHSNSVRGGQPMQRHSLATTPNGTQYAVCTTVQYGYKPSSNVTVLIVKPQSRYRDNNEDAGTNAARSKRQRLAQRCK
jgi:hypothetical protein